MNKIQRRHPKRALLALPSALIALLFIGLGGSTLESFLNPNDWEERVIFGAFTILCGSIALAGLLVAVVCLLAAIIKDTSIEDDEEFDAELH